VEKLAIETGNATAGCAELEAVGPLKLKFIFVSVLYLSGFLSGTTYIGFVGFVLVKLRTQEVAALTDPP
jgi:hypothetical protein